MRRFEVGKIYKEHESRPYIVIARTKKTVTVQRIVHQGRPNEFREEAETKRAYEWEGREVINPHDETIEA